MADNLAVTPGSGATIATDQVTADSSHIQLSKLAISADGDRTLIPADATYGIDVDVTRVTGNVTVVDGGSTVSVDDGGGNLSVDDGAGSLTVDAPVGTPVFVRLSNGSSAISALPVTDNSTTLSVDDGGGNLSIDDGGNTITVDGTVAVTQSTAAAVASGWPVKVTDGTDTVGISTVSAAKGLKVDVIQAANDNTKTDKTTFTEGTSKVGVIGGVYNETLAGDPSEDQASVVRITAKRGLHVNLRNVAGTEISTQTAPVLVQTTYGDQTRVTVSVSMTASQTGATVWDPAAGKKFVIEDAFMRVSGAGDCAIFDGTNAAANMLFDGTWAVTDIIDHSFRRPWISSTADNVLKYTSGSGFAGKITLHGYEITP